MNMGSVAVVVLVDVELAAQDVPCGADSEVDEHDADAEFEVWCDGFVALQGDVFDDQNDGTEDEERDRVSRAPRGTQPDALPDVSFFRNHVRDCDNVIGIGGVFDSEQKTECDYGEYACLKIQ